MIDKRVKKNVTLGQCSSLRLRVRVQTPVLKTGRWITHEWCSRPGFLRVYSEGLGCWVCFLNTMRHDRLSTEMQPLFTVALSGLCLNYCISSATCSLRRSPRRRQSPQTFERNARICSRPLDMCPFLHSHHVVARRDSGELNLCG